MDDYLFWKIVYDFCFYYWLTITNAAIFVPIGAATVAYDDGRDDVVTEADALATDDVFVTKYMHGAGVISPNDIWFVFISGCFKAIAVDTHKDTYAYSSFWWMIK